MLFKNSLFYWVSCELYFFRSGDALQLSFTNNQCQVIKITLFYEEIKQYLIENVELECV